jgi:hypothetical protein
MKKSIAKHMLLWMWMAMAFIPFAGADAGGIEVQRYVEQKDGAHRPVLWQLAQADGYRLIYQNPEEVHTTETDAQLRTRAWHMSNATKEVFMQATRETNAIVVRGSFKGRVIDERLAVDQDPWYQATSLSLRGFVRSPAERIHFWTLRPDTLKAVKLTATKVAREEIKAAGRLETAVKVELRAGGWRAPFWKSHYWYRASDGLLLHFEGQNGPSAANRIVIAYTGPGPAEPLAAPLATAALAASGPATQPEITVDVSPETVQVGD